MEPATKPASEARPNGVEPAPAKVVAPVPKKSKAMRAYLVLGALALVALAVYFIHGYITRNEVYTDDAQVDADVVPVATRVGGVVLKMNVEDNQKVAAGAPDRRDRSRRLPGEGRCGPGRPRGRAGAGRRGRRAGRDQTSASAGGLSSAKAMVRGTGASVSRRGAGRGGGRRGRARQGRARQGQGRLRAREEAARRGRDPGPGARPAVDRARLGAAAVDAANGEPRRRARQQAGAESRVAEAQGQLEQSAPVEQRSRPRRGEPSSPTRTSTAARRRSSSRSSQRRTRRSSRRPPATSRSSRCTTARWCSPGR